MKNMLLLFTWIAIFSVGGCGGNAGSGSNGATLTGIAITPSTAAVARGTETSFTAIGTYSDNTTSNITSHVTWASSNTSVATVNSTGVATALSTGSTDISASSADIHSNTAGITVVSPPSAAPVGVTAQSETSQVTLSWSPVGDATSYNIYWGKTAGITTASNKIIGATAPYVHTGITTGNTYYYRVSAANVGGETLSDEISAGTSKVGPFTAAYYSGATFVATESVERPSINYAYADFHAINSSNFHAVWTGNIEIFNIPQTIDINFDVSWSDISLFIDGVNVDSWSNSNRSIRYAFSPGIHEIKIEYYNHWHTTGFNVSFTKNTMYSKDEAKSLIAPRIDNSTKVIYVGCYESGTLYNNNTVTLNGTASKVFLFLSSYDSANWIINNPQNVTITGIAYSSYSTVSTVSAGNTIPTFEIAGLAYGYSNFSGPSADITYLIGRGPDYYQGAYGLTEAVISIP